MNIQNMNLFNGDREQAINIAKLKKTNKTNPENILETIQDFKLHLLMNYMLMVE